jgi:hypothetical protein
MTATKFRKHPIAMLRRHWTIHALEQFCARYNPADYEPEALVDLVDRIEGNHRAAFANPYWDKHSQVIVTKLTRRNPAVSPKVRIVYDRRTKVIVTVLPLKLGPNRPRRLKTLTV